MAPGGSVELSIRKFKELVEQKSQGNMVVTPFLGGQLGDHQPSWRAAESALHFISIGRGTMFIFRDA